MTIRKYLQFGELQTCIFFQCFTEIVYLNPEIANPIQKNDRKPDF